jgi:diguanylate cyclase (GGDEF)-like protein
MPHLPPMRESPRPAEFPQVVLFLTSLGLLFTVCLFDRLAGNINAFSFFYLIPIYAAAWYVGATAGVTIAVFSYALMALVDAGFDAAVTLRGLRDSSSISILLFFVLSALVTTRLRIAFRREHDLSSHDSLTGVFNRREFFLLAEVERLRAIRYARAITLVFIDLDEFKNVNDRFGHAAGDALLLTVAKTLKVCVRGTDLVARLGGDEFILLLEETDAEAAQRIVVKLREGLSDQLAQTSCPVTASMGVITFATPPASVDEMVHAADDLMYTAKRSGGDRAIFRISQHPFSGNDIHASGT